MRTRFGTNARGLALRIGTATVLLAGAATAVSAQSVWDAVKQPPAGVYELRCRGGAGFEFRSLGFKLTPGNVDIRVALAMTFAASEAAAANNSEGLKPGTCAWIDRPVNGAEPREIHFVTPAYAQLMKRELDTSPTAAERFADAQSIASYLSDPNHYWSFTAFNTNNGYFDATAHRYWKSAARSAAADSHVSSATPHWMAQASTGGGISGQVIRVSVNADGRLIVAGSPRPVVCSTELRPPELQKIEAAIVRSHPEKWRESYARDGNPNGCCDQIGSSLSIGRENAEGRMTQHHTGWFSESGNLVPEDASSLFGAIWEAGKVCTLIR